LLDSQYLICYISSMRCKICQKEFIPSKYRPNQQVCSQSECQRMRQIQNERDWRLKNPDYFKYLDQEPAWKGKRHLYNSLWRGSHKDELKEYELGHSQERKKYMREYMRRWRKKT